MCLYMYNYTLTKSTKDDEPSASKRSCIDPQQLESELENKASDLSFESDDLPLSEDVSELGSTRQCVKLLIEAVIEAVS